MPITFPALCPTDREFTCADYPLTEGVWRGGVAAFPRAWSDTPVSAQLRLRYQHVADSAAAQFLVAWYQSGTGMFPLSLPEEIVGGISDPDLRERILSPPGLQWRFSGIPQVTRIMPGISNVQVQLGAEAEQPLVVMVP